eukprot:m.5510 g.5510  ORF g.5510 m.5510 type:complete len:676 (-) comp3321_c0_seq1:98-2125(-)
MKELIVCCSQQLFSTFINIYWIFNPSSNNTMFLLILLFTAVSVVAEPLNGCRCRYPQLCYTQLPWDELNTTLSGRLQVVHDEMAPCLHNISSLACSNSLAKTDEQFFYTGQIGGYMHTGLAYSWNISHPLARYAVAAITEADIANSLKFAHEHNLRVAVKATGHDWFGRSGSHPDYEGSFMIWTHLRKNITWHDEGFVGVGCPQSSRVPAVTVESGVQFADLYPIAEKRGSFVNGGGCTSVGFGGCTLGGCFGSFSQSLGPTASNLLQARIALANGTILTLSECEHADLFWAIRGGGAGYGVVLEFTMRAYKTPQYITTVSYEGVIESAGNNNDNISNVAVEILRAADTVARAHQGWNGGLSVPFPARLTFGITLNTYEGNVSAGIELLQPLAQWVTSQPFLSGKLSSNVKHRGNNWFEGPAPEGQQQLPWDLPHHDSEIGTEHLVSMSKWITHKALQQGPGDYGLKKVAHALINISTLASSGLLATLPGRVGVDMEKALGGAAPYTSNLARNTSLPPAVLDSVGFVTSQWRIPALPQLEQTSTVLKTLWPRLKVYAITNSSDELYSICEAGANGSESQAKVCFTRWNARKKAIVGELDTLRNALLEHFPVNNSYSGSYWNEADYYEPNWQMSFWGENYEKLLTIKKKYDASGLFVCHHCVGSEFWSPDGNCPLT